MSTRYWDVDFSSTGNCVSHVSGTVSVQRVFVEVVLKDGWSRNKDFFNMKILDPEVVFILQILTSFRSLSLTLVQHDGQSTAHRSVFVFLKAWSEEKT